MFINNKHLYSLEDFFEKIFYSLFQDLSCLQATKKLILTFYIIYKKNKMKNFLKIWALALWVVVWSAVVNPTHAQNTGTSLDLFINSWACTAQIDSGYYLTGSTSFTWYDVALESTTSSWYISDMLWHDQDWGFTWNLTLNTASGLVHDDFTGVVIAPALIAMKTLTWSASWFAATNPASVYLINTADYTANYWITYVQGLLQVNDTNGSIFIKTFDVWFRISVPANQAAGLYNADYEVNLPFGDSLCTVTNVA